MRPQRITQEQMTKKMVSEQKLDEKQTKKYPPFLLLHGSLDDTSDGEHREVVVRFSTVAVRLYRQAEGVDYLLGSI